MVGRLSGAPSPYRVSPHHLIATEGPTPRCLFNRNGSGSSVNFTVEVWELSALRKLNLNHLHMPDAVVFLDVAPEVSLERIETRGKALQAHESLGKLTKLRDAYHLVCDALKRLRPVCRLDRNKSLDQLVQGL